MHHARPARLALGPAAIALALWLASGCGPSDLLERVRTLQDVRRDHVAALGPLREMIEAGTEDPEVYFRYGQALVSTGDMGLAVLPLERAMQSPEWFERSALVLAGTRLNQRAFDEAAEICGRILEREPDHVEALLLRAGARMHRRSHYEEMLADAERVLEIDPDEHRARSPRLVALLGLGRIEEAGEALEELEGLRSDETLGLHGSPPLCMARATFAKEQGETDVAEERYLRCLEQFPDEGIVLSGVVGFFDGMGQPERSQEFLEDALERRPQASGLRTEMALRLLAIGKQDEAEALLLEGTEVAPPRLQVNAWSALAAFNVDQGDLDDAIEAYATAWEFDTTRSPQLLLAYADALVIGRRFDEAERVVAKMDLPAHRFLVLGRIELERGNPGGALEHFEQGMLLWPNNAIARYYAAIAAERIGDLDRAIQEYRYALRIDATATDAYLRLARLQAALGRYDDALGSLDFKPGGRPDEVTAGLLQMRLLASLDRLARTPQRVQRLLALPENRGEAVAALGAGVRESRGPEASLQAMRAVGPLDLSDPAHAAALAAIVEDLATTGKPDEGLTLVEAGLRAHPDSADFLALRGRASLLAGAPRDAVRVDFEAALELDPDHGAALRGLARIEAEAKRLESALGFYDRALAADATDRIAAREAASLLREAGRNLDAEAKLDALLREQPYDADTAFVLAASRAGRGERDATTLALARRAVALGAGDEAEALAERLAAPGTPDEGAAR